MVKKADRPVPAGMNTLTPHLWYGGNCRDAIDFYKKALGAEVLGEIASGPDGKSVMHAMMQIGDSHIMMADAWPGSWETAPDGNATAGMWIYVADCDALFERATAAGCEVMYPMMDAFWGDRMGKVKDPYGHCWAIATHKFDYTPEEIEAGQKEWLASMNS